MDTLTPSQKIKIKAAANDWISKNLPIDRKLIIHSAPEYNEVSRVWNIGLTTRNRNGRQVTVGNLVVDNNACIVKAQAPQSISARISQLLEGFQEPLAIFQDTVLDGEGYEFRLDDGVECSKTLVDGTVDLLLTDPPYGISNSYTCENQVPRRLRKNGTDFIMPKGNFGDWDGAIEPREWANIVLPKVGGWAVIFCAQAQIGEYSDVLKSHKFNAVGTLVWHKTNPVPFNHRYKPINAWEALVVGKRPGTKFNGSVVHNVFECKSPSPQQRIHPTQKPLPLIEEFIQLFSGEGDRVFDPFAGSATTVIAARRHGRRVLAYEKDPKIFRLACDRVVKEMTS
jgi:DNA modification methylase